MMVSGAAWRPPAKCACFSLLRDRYGISIAHRCAFEPAGNKLVAVGGGTTAYDAADEELAREAAHAEAWFQVTVNEVIGVAGRCRSFDRRGRQPGLGWFGWQRVRPDAR